MTMDDVDEEKDTEQKNDVFSYNLGL